MIKMMLKQYSEDKSLFRKNMDMALILIVVGLVAIYFLNSFRVNMIAQAIPNNMSNLLPTRPGWKNLT